MKKINKTVLLASTLFISQAFYLTDKSQASEDYKLDQGLHSEENAVSQKPVENSTEEINVEQAEVSGASEAEKATSQNPKENIEETKEERPQAENTQAQEVSVESPEALSLEENTQKAEASPREENIIYYDDTNLDDIVKEAKEEDKTVVGETKKIEEKKYYAPNTPGYFVKSNKAVNYYENDQLVKNANLKVDNKIYRADKTGAISNPKNTWLNIGSDIYYNKEDGNFTRGISEIKNEKYYFSNEGILQKNKKLITQGAYYEVGNDGKMRLTPNKWVNVQKNIYRTLEDGSIAKGVTQIGKSNFMFDKNGRLQTNKKIIADDKYYNVNKLGVITNPKNAWLAIDGTTYRTNSNGDLVKGVSTINSNTYVFDYKTGGLIVGRPSITNGKYYDIDDRGVATNPKNSWVVYEGGKYHTNSEGYIKEGVWRVDGKLYYFGKDGLQGDTKVIQQGIEYAVDSNGVATPVDNRKANEKNLDKVMEWMFVARDNGMYYNMGAKRNTTEAADCSSAVYRSLIYGGFLDKGTFIGNTETLFAMGDRGSVMYEISEDEIDYGDIFVSGTPGKSIGAGGHTGFILNPLEDTIIHMSYSQNGVAVTPRKGYMGESSTRPVRYYRLVGANSDRLYANKK